MRKFSFLILGLLLALLGLHWIASSDSPAPYLWRDGLLIALAGTLLFAAHTHALTPSPSHPFTLSPPLFFLLILLLGGFLRLWQIESAPPDCIGEECTRAMRLLEGNNQSGGVGIVAQWIGRSASLDEEGGSWPEAGQSALRYAGALIGILTLPTLYLLGRRLGRPLGGLAAMLLLAISPWHIWASRSGDPWLLPMVGIFLLCWALIGFWRQRGWVDGVAALLALALLVGAVVLTPTINSAAQTAGEIISPLATPDPLAAAGEASEGMSIRDQLWQLVQALFHSDTEQPDSPFAAFPLLDRLTAALALAGLVTILRWLRQPTAILLALVLLGCGVAVLWGGTGMESLLLPAAYLCAVVALAQVMGNVDLHWQPLFTPARLAAVACVALLFPVGAQTKAFFSQLDSLRTTSADAVNASVARYLVDQAQQQPNTTFVVPPGVQRDPAARLLAGKLLASGKVQPLDPALLPVSLPTLSDLEFVFPASDVVLAQFLQQIYPTGQFGQEVDANGRVPAAGESGISIAWLRVPLAAQPGQTMPAIGLNATYYAGEQSQDNALMQRQDPIPGYPIQLDQAYNVLWDGYLAAGRSGEYLLGTVSDGSIAMMVDGKLLFDSSASLPGFEQVAEESAEADTMQPHESAIYLEKGWHPIQIRHTPRTVGASIKFYWQPPGSAPEPLHPLYFLPLRGDPSSFPPPPIPGVVDEGLGSFDGFALTSNIDLWQTNTRIPPSNLPVLATQLVWRTETACGAGEEALNQPHGVAIDATGGHIYVADTGNQRLQRYTLAGKPDKSYQDDAFVEPFDLALGNTLDNTRQIWLLDSGNHAILRLDAESGKVEPFAVSTSFYFPRGIAVDPAGNLLVADTGGARVVVLNARGELLTTFGGAGSALQTGQPVDVMIQNGIPWATTAEDGRLWQLNTLGSIGAMQRNNTINGPKLAPLDERGFFASDPARHAILFFSAIGQPRYAVEGGFGEPTGIATALLEGQPYLAVVDSQACTLSLWRLPAFQ